MHIGAMCYLAKTRGFGYAPSSTEKSLTSCSHSSRRWRLVTEGGRLWLQRRSDWERMMGMRWLWLMSSRKEPSPVSMKLAVTLWWA